MAEHEPCALPPKLYFRIGEVAELVGVEPHVIRYWEREFRSVRPEKSAKGQRVYSRRDVEILVRVRALLYNDGFTIAGARRKLRQDSPQSADGAAPEAGGADTPARDSGDLPLRGDPASGEAAPGGSPRSHARLLALRADIEAFLAELEADDRDAPAK